MFFASISWFLGSVRRTSDQFEKRSQMEWKCPWVMKMYMYVCMYLIPFFTSSIVLFIAKTEFQFCLAALWRVLAKTGGDYFHAHFHEDGVSKNIFRFNNERSIMILFCVDFLSYPTISFITVNSKYLVRSMVFARWLMKTV